MKILSLILMSLFLVNCAKNEDIQSVESVRRPILIVVGETPFLEALKNNYPEYDLVNKGTGCNHDCNYENVANYIIMFKLNSKDMILILDHTMQPLDLTQSIEYARSFGVQADGLASN